MLQTIDLRRMREELRGIVLTLCLVGAATVLIYALVAEAGLAHGSLVYVVPVLVAAARWGMVSAIVAAVCGMLASAFFFFPPLYTLRIKDPQEVVNLILFVLVAIVVSHLASRLKRELETARRREIEMRDLYAFSRRLAVAFDVRDIHAAIEDHLAAIMQQPVLLFPGAREAAAAASRDAPPAVLAAVAEAASRRSADGKGSTVAANGESWLVRAVSPNNAEFGVIAINLRRASPEELAELRRRIDAVLADATATLERLDIARAIGEARMRAQTDQLRDALIESVSHELRTPLASILGAATVLSAAPALQNEKKLKALVHDVRDEAERLNHDIQNLLDATRISSEGVKPRVEWAEPADIIHSAVERCRDRLCDRRLSIDLAPDLPLVQVDPVLVQQALVQIFDNAAKYSEPGSRIAASARAVNGHLAISVSDEGAGLTRSEQARMWDRFVRGERLAAKTKGSGLGLWIANAFIAANGGKMQAASAGAGLGATMTIELPVTHAAVPQMEGDEDE